jgi:hypothetical protein
VGKIPLRKEEFSPNVPQNTLKNAQKMTTSKDPSES